jgi:predicted amino acid-binding ACT domain protein
MNILQKDEVGIPSTIVAVSSTVFNAMGIDFLNVILTLIISVLSIVYFIYKIKNEKAIHDKRENEKRQ